MSLTSFNKDSVLGTVGHSQRFTGHVRVESPWGRNTQRRLDRDSSECQAGSEISHSCQYRQGAGEWLQVSLVSLAWYWQNIGTSATGAEDAPKSLKAMLRAHYLRFPLLPKTAGHFCDPSKSQDKIPKACVLQQL